MTSAPELLSAEQFLAAGELPDNVELVLGHVVTIPLPNLEHGLLCGRIAFEVMAYLETHDLGSVLTNNAGVVTHREPDSVRGPDVAFYSFVRMPKRERRHKGYPSQPPEIVFEVLSPSDSWKDVHIKTAEYLNAGVNVVSIVDPETGCVSMYWCDGPPTKQSSADTIEFPELLPGFSLPVKTLFAD